MRFGPFEIERPLGRGGMAETFVARYRTTQGFERTVCLKRILAEHAASADFVAAFQEEAKLQMRLVHPHIVQVYDFGEVDGAWWISLELIGGGDLRSFLKELGQPMPLDLVLVLAIDLASALEYAHSLVVDGRPANLVHRDVSPSNVLIDEQGNFKLVDFGIAKSSLSGSETTTGKVKGKASYMAPEQGLGRKVDRRADLWALGVVLFEALAGERPFEAPSDLATILLITEGSRKTLKEAAPHVPDDVCAVVEKLLAVEPDARFASASEVLEAFEHRPPPVTARRRLAQIVKRVQAGEPRSDLPPAMGPAAEAGAARGTLAITSLALGGAGEDEPVPAAPDAETRTRTIFDADLERALSRGAFDPTQRHDSLAPRPATPGAPATDSASAPLASVVVSPEATPERFEVTETRRAFSRAWPLIAAAVVLAGLVAGAVVAGLVLLAARAPGADPRTMSTPVDAFAPPDALAPPDAFAPPVDAFAPVDAFVPPVDAFVPEDVFAPPDAFVPTDVPIATDARGPRPADRDPAPASDAPRTGRIEVVVVPWGRVEIDGRDVGRSPYRGRVETGVHRVVGVAGESRRTRSVRVTGDGIARVSISME